MCAQEICDSYRKHKYNNGGGLAASAETKVKRDCLCKGRKGNMENCTVGRLQRLSHLQII